MDSFISDLLQRYQNNDHSIGPGRHAASCHGPDGERWSSSGKIKQLKQDQGCELQLCSSHYQSLSNPDKEVN